VRDIAGSSIRAASLFVLFGVPIVASLGLICGCRVGGVADVSVDPRGDGLPERVITDAALWDTRADGAPDALDGGGADGDDDGRGDGDGDGDGRGGRDGDGDGGAAGDGSAADAEPACDLLTPSCPAQQACYPFPFEGTPAGDRRCASVGAGGPSVPCQSQLECDQGSLCTAPGEPDSICAKRCDPGEPRCPAGERCQALPLYPGVGSCRA
jgi:hypothetical protein